MNILIQSTRFDPSVGGMESMMLMLAREFMRAGHRIKVLTDTEANGSDHLEFEVLRSASIADQLTLVRWCDIYFAGCVSLRAIWLPLLLRKPIVVSHHTWYQRSDGSLGWQDFLKKLVTTRVHNIAVSRAIAGSIWGQSVVIPNCWEEEIFQLYEEVQRERELIFVGRLVSDKGVDLLINALAQLRSNGHQVRLSIVGEGPEESNIRALVASLGMQEAVTFCGVLTGKDLARQLNRHRILVVPSRWEEPFGIVALEGIACGCIVVGSSAGGLPEAIGKCGLTFPNGDIAALAGRLEQILDGSLDSSFNKEIAQEHLELFRPSQVGQEYLKVIAEATE